MTLEREVQLLEMAVRRPTQLSVISPLVKAGIIRSRESRTSSKLCYVLGLMTTLHYAFLLLSTYSHTRQHKQTITKRTASRSAASHGKSKLNCHSRMNLQWLQILRSSKPRLTFLFSCQAGPMHAPGRCLPG